MGGPAQALTPLQQLLDFMRQFEMRLQQVRTGLGTIQGRPRVQQLINLQTVLRLRLEQLNVNFWNQDPVTRTAALQPYLSAALTAKLVIDDVYVEASEEVAPELPGQKPVPKTAAQTAATQKLSDQIEGNYQTTIEAWIVGSPLIDPKTRVGNEAVLPKVTNAANFPTFRNLAAHARRLPSSKTEPIDGARAQMQSELARLAGSQGPARLSPEAIHLLGLAFLLAQLELKQRARLDSTTQTGVDEWYEAALRPVQTIAVDVLGGFDAAYRAATVAGRSAEAERLQSAREIAVADLATQFSLRRQETQVLLTFFERENQVGLFASQDNAMGVNNVVETLFTYPGVPNPDHQSGRNAASVSVVRAHAAELVTQDEVPVFGRIDTAKTQLLDEATREQLRVIGVGDVPGLLTAVGRDRRVLINGKLTGSGATLTLAANRVQLHSQAYRALVGFPLEFGQTNRDNGNLEQAPSWRRLTNSLQRAAVREHDERVDDGVFSVAETLARQRDFVNGLLDDADIRTTFAAALKTNLDLDLQNRETRPRVWSTLFKRFAPQGHGPAIKLLIAYIQEYLDIFTKHTYFNLRDDGKPYLESDWPTDLTNRLLYDCGVYAVLTAYDLYRAVQGTSGLTLEFRFLTFLNHICLVVFFDEATFLVNNGTIAAPVEVKRRGTLADDRLNATFQWSRQAFATVYNVDHIVFIAVVVPQLTLDTNRSDADFRRAIATMYQNSLGWGISSNAKVAGEYLEAIQLFDAGSKALDAQVKTLAAGKGQPADWEDATKRALTLYTLAEKMAEPANFSASDKFLKQKPRPAVGFHVQRPRERGRLRERPTDAPKGKPTLPMYELGRLLAAGRSGAPLTPNQAALVQKPKDDAHMDELTDRLTTLPAAKKP